MPKEIKENWEKELLKLIKTGEMRAFPKDGTKGLLKGKMGKLVGYCELGL